MKREVDLLCFDLDGTLADTGRDLASSVNYTLSALGLSPIPEETIRNFVGDGITELVSRVLGEDKKHLVDQALLVFLRHYREHLVDTTHLYPGVVECLEYFRWKKKIVLSNKRQEFVEHILMALKIRHYFLEVIGGDVYPFMKPDPRLVIPMLEKYGAQPERAVMIGDGVNDILVARRAGMISCAFLHGLSRAEDLRALSADYYCDNLAELKDIFC